VTYLDETADAIRASVPDGVDVPPDARDLFLAYAVLLRAKGPAVTASDVHDAWVAWMLTRDGEHPALQPFEQLADDVRALDEPFRQAILAAAGAP